MSAGGVYEFGEFRIDLGKRLLLRKGEPVSLVPKAFDILALLIQQRERIVAKADILRAVWPDTFVEDGNLTQNISVLRKALGESPSEHKFIVTVPGRGYRFSADVREVVTVRDEFGRAHQFFLKGRHLLNKRLTGTLTEAITCFLQSTDEDPLFAPAWVGLADAYALLSPYGASMPREVFPKSKAAALSALRLDPALAEAHNSLGVVELFYEWHWDAAERELRRAIELNPRYGDAHQRYGIYLTAMGRFTEAHVALAKAQESDPLSRIIATIAGYPSYYSRDYDAAVRQFRHVSQIDPNFSMAHFRLGLTWAQMGQYDRALEELSISKGLSNDRDVVAALGYVHALRGDRTEVSAAIAELHERSRDTFVSPYQLAVIYVAMGDTALAFEWLEKALVEKSYWIIYLNVDPALDPLRADPRFDDLRRRAGLA